TEGESAVVRVRLEVRVEELGKAESDEEAQDQWDVVNAFVTEAEGGGHGGAPARGGGEGRFTAARSRRKEPRAICVDKDRMRGIDKEIISDKLYVCSAKEGC